jgi:hypothetical protein
MCLSLSLYGFYLILDLECENNKESLESVHLLEAKHTFHRPGRRVTIPHCVTSALRTLSLSLSVAKWAKDSWHWLVNNCGGLLCDMLLVANI